MVSLAAVVVIVTLEPAAIVSVSVVESATTSSCPDTDIVLNVSEEVLTVCQLQVPSPSILSSCSRSTFCYPTTSTTYNEVAVCAT